LVKNQLSELLFVVDLAKSIISHVQPVIPNDLRHSISVHNTLYPLEMHHSEGVLFRVVSARVGHFADTYVSPPFYVKRFERGL
jgi:hypothetical protein